MNRNLKNSEILVLSLSAFAFCGICMLIHPNEGSVAGMILFGVVAAIAALVAD